MTIKRARKSKEDREIDKWASVAIEPVWEHSSTPSPSHQQWFDWNNVHGTSLRIALAIELALRPILRPSRGRLDAGPAIQLQRGSARTVELYALS
jgi:hypothetical protein